jgi:hypothetical protein
MRPVAALARSSALVALGMLAAPSLVFAQTVEGAATPGFAPLMTRSAACEIAVRTTENAGIISIDGELRGEGDFKGWFQPGRHTIRVERGGFEPFESVRTCVAGDVYVESVLLKPSIGLTPTPRDEPATAASGDGLYGGVQLLAAFQPGGSGTTFQDACDTTGATSCSPGSVVGGGIHGYVGWMLDPLGLEIAMFGTGDVVSPSATFDGETGSEINPIVATPARTEDFTIARFGGGAALRARVSTQVSKFRFALALGPGLTYRYLAMKRDTEAEGGLHGEVADTGTGYLSALLSVELSAHVMLGRNTALSLGLLTWLEHAGSDVESEAIDEAVLLGGERPVPQATPAYDMAAGTQWFLGPFLGLAFGP